MKLLAKRITKDNRAEAIQYCREHAIIHPEKWNRDDPTGYKYAAELLRFIDKEEMIIHVYTDDTYEFKKIRKKKDEQK